MDGNKLLPVVCARGMGAAA